MGGEDAFGIDIPLVGLKTGVQPLDRTMSSLFLPNHRNLLLNRIRGR